MSTLRETLELYKNYYPIAQHLKLNHALSYKTCAGHDAIAIDMLLRHTEDQLDVEGQGISGWNKEIYGGVYVDDATSICYTQPVSHSMLTLRATSSLTVMQAAFGKHRHNYTDFMRLLSGAFLTNDHAMQDWRSNDVFCAAGVAALRATTLRGSDNHESWTTEEVLNFFHRAHREMVANSVRGRKISVLVIGARHNGD